MAVSYRRVFPGSRCVKGRPSARERASVEREFGPLKHELRTRPPSVRGVAKVQIHTDLTMLARLSQAVARARAVPLAA